MVRCIDCENFAGRQRDKTAALFRSGRGYCNDKRHPGGVWNVVQHIDRERDCPLYKPADKAICDMRRQALRHYEAKGGESPCRH